MNLTLPFLAFRAPVAGDRVGFPGMAPESRRPVLWQGPYRLPSLQQDQGGFIQEGHPGFSPAVKQP